MLAVTTSSHHTVKHKKTSNFYSLSAVHLITASSRTFENVRSSNKYPHAPQTDHRRGKTIRLQWVILKCSHLGQMIKVLLDAKSKGRKQREILSKWVSMCVGQSRQHWLRRTVTAIWNNSDACKLSDWLQASIIKESNSHRTLSRINPIWNHQWFLACGFLPLRFTQC